MNTTNDKQMEQPTEAAAATTADNAAQKADCFNYGNKEYL